MKKTILRAITVLLLLALLGQGVLGAEESAAPEDPTLTAGQSEPADPTPADGQSTPQDPGTAADPAETGQPLDEPLPADPGAVSDPEPEPSGTQEPEEPGLESTIIRVGLYYGSGAMDGANLANYTGSGFYLGYYDADNDFISVAQTAAESISVVKTENVGYGNYNGYTSYHAALAGSAAVTVGCYHLQTLDTYDSFDDASAAAAQYTGGFVAWLAGTYRVRIGNYTDRDSAVAAQESWAMNAGLTTELKGTSAYAVSVVATGTANILFQFDDNGAGTGLGVEPMPAEAGEKCVTYFMNGNRWYGGFRYERINGGSLTIVNMVALDDYVKGILPYEMSSSWPIEALKVQAVCARSYSLNSRGGKHRGNHFDLCNNSCCQVYLGLARATTATDAAVDETCGQVARYNGKIATCYYYSSNGGASESSSTVWGSSQSTYPYLVGVEDPFEATVEDKISGYRWTRTYTAAELTSKLNAKGYKCSTIVSVKVSAYTDTGNPKTIAFTDSNGKTYSLNSRALVTMLSLRSYRYDFVGAETPGISINEDITVDSTAGLYALDGSGNLVPVGDSVYIITDSGTELLDTGSTAVSGDSFTISGSGWGHNVGMSQWGSFAMAQLGYTYEQILCFYYTGITVGK